MTFREFMQENGYDLITTFWEDFSIADKYGKEILLRQVNR